MKLLIVAATAAELEPFFNHFHLNAPVCQKLAAYETGGHSVEGLITGAGMVAMAAHLSNCQLKKYDLVINAGIAGTFDPKLSNGTILRVVKDTFAELGADTDQGFVPYVKDERESIHNLISYSEASVIAGNFRLPGKIMELSTATAITVNTLSASGKRIALFRELFNPDLETMEGAAFMYVCRLADVPAVQIRSVSNRVGPKAPGNWNIPFAVSNLCRYLCGLILSL